MDVITIVLALLVQILSLLPGAGRDEVDEATQQRMREYEEMLSREMTRLWQELLQDSQSSSAWGALRFAASQQWHIWAFSAVLVLLFGLCCWVWKRCSLNNVLPEEEEEKPSTELDVGRYISDGVLHLPTSFSVVLDFVNDILCECQTISEGTFNPIVQSAIATGCSTNLWGPDEHRAVYRMLVPLTAPLAHSFHLEQGTTGEVSWKGRRIRVELECICQRELLEDRMCLLHHPEEELSGQPPSMLKTLCTDSYLDMGKTVSWFEGLLHLACQTLPPYGHGNLEVLRSRRSCYLQLTTEPNITLLIQLELGVEEGDSYAAIID